MNYIYILFAHHKGNYCLYVFTFVPLKLAFLHIYQSLTNIDEKSTTSDVITRIITKLCYLASTYTTPRTGRFQRRTTQAQLVLSGRFLSSDKAWMHHLIYLWRVQLSAIVGRVEMYQGSVHLISLVT
jgi:hypothetical protein